MQKNPEMPISKWVTSVRDVVRQIKDLKGDIPDEEITLILTNSLSESYAPLVVQLDTMGESHRTLGHVITLLIGEGRCHTMHFACARCEEHTQRPPRDYLFRMWRKGHFRSDCPQEKGSGSREAEEAWRRHAVSVPASLLQDQGERIMRSVRIWDSLVKLSSPMPLSPTCQASP